MTCWKLSQYLAIFSTSQYTLEETYSFEHGAPPSLPIAHNNRLPDVTLPIVPLMKHTARAQLITTPAVRLSVAWMISSISGLPVRVVRMASGLGMQNSRMMIIEIPLQAVSIGLMNSCTKLETYVTPPIATHISIAIGASRVGRGISSVMWVIASYPISDKLGFRISNDRLLLGYASYLSSTPCTKRLFRGLEEVVLRNLLVE